MADVMEIRESSIADPGALGLAGFAFTTFILSMSNAHLVPAALGALFVPGALFYGGIAQILAGMWEFKKNNVFGATAFTSYGAFWLVLASTVILGALKIVNLGSAEASGIGLILIGYTIFTFYMWIGTFRLNNCLLSVFTFLLIAFILLDLANFGIISSVPGGIFGLITALCAWYTSAAVVLNTVYGHPVLPVGSRQKIILKAGTAAK